MTSTPFDPEDPGWSAATDNAPVSASGRYAFWAGDHRDALGADRWSAAELAEALPSIRLAAREMRKLMIRTMTYLAHSRGIHQFLDIGCGLPASPNVHQIARGIDRSCRVVYVDRDPVVGAHARALMAWPPKTVFVHGDLARANEILHHDEVRDALDFTQPIGVLLLAVLHFIIDDDVAQQAVADIKRAIPSGSYVAISHTTFDPLPPEQAAWLCELADPEAGHGGFRARPRSQVERFFDGLDMVRPGLVSTVEVLAGRRPRPRITVEQAVGYAGIGRKP